MIVFPFFFFTCLDVQNYHGGVKQRMVDRNFGKFSIDELFDLLMQSRKNNIQRKEKKCNYCKKSLSKKDQNFFPADKSKHKNFKLKHYLNFLNMQINKTILNILIPCLIIHIKTQFFQELQHNVPQLIAFFSVYHFRMAATNTLDRFIHMLGKASFRSCKAFK